jgi:hypothetical protein
MKSLYGTLYYYICYTWALFSDFFSTQFRVYIRLLQAEIQVYKSRSIKISAMESQISFPWI